MRRETLAGTVIAFVLTTLFACLIGVWSVSPRFRRPDVGNARSTPPSASETTLAEAREWRHRAMTEVHRRREELDAWDSTAGDAGNRESTAHDPWRLQQLAADEKGYLLRARTAARRAVETAQTPRERYRAAVLLAGIEHERGDHDRELQQARALVALQPRSDLALLTLRRAARCSGRPSLAESIDAKLAALWQ
jgi:hypothetical protein